MCVGCQIQIAASESSKRVSCPPHMVPNCAELESTLLSHQERHLAEILKNVRELSFQIDLSFLINKCLWVDLSFEICSNEPLLVRDVAKSLIPFDDIYFQSAFLII